MTKAIRYEIQGPDHLGDFRLVSIVKTSFGGDAVNFVCRGTRDYCEQIKAKLRWWPCADLADGYRKARELGLVDYTIGESK